MATALAWTTTASSISVCPSCYFGATAASVHSFPYKVLGSIKEEVIIYSTECVDGDFETFTTTTTILPPGLTTIPPDVKIFDSIEEMTWTIDGVCASYPTTYAHYLGFERDSFAIETSIPVRQDICIGYKVTTPVVLPAPTVPASFIYPAPTISYSTSDGTELIAVPLPTALIDYLDSCDGVGLENVKQCQPLSTWYTNGPPATQTDCVDTVVMAKTSTEASTSTLVSALYKDNTLTTTFADPYAPTSSSESSSTLTDSATMVVTQSLNGTFAGTTGQNRG